MNFDVTQGLLDAVKAGDDLRVEQFLALGADPNVSTGRTQGNVLSLAAGSGQLRIVILLLDGGADIGPSGPYTPSPLRRAIKGRYPDIVRLLLERGAIDREIGDASGILAEAMDAVRHAPQPAALEIVRTVLAHGAHPQAGSRASLVGAVTMRSTPSILRILIEAGEDPDQRRGDGTPVLVLAARRGDAAAVDALLQAGADVDAVDADGRTALMHAIERDERDVVSILRLAGADADTISAGGITAIGLAKGWQRQRIQILLGERIVGLDNTPIPRTVIGIRRTGFRLEGDSATFELWGRLLQHAVKDLGSDEWEAHTGMPVADAVEFARRLRDEPQAATEASWHTLDASGEELSTVRAALRELAYGSPGSMPAGMSRDEIADLYEELDRRII